MKKIILLTISTLGVLIVACKEKDVPTPIITVATAKKDTIIPVRKIVGVKLYNQGDVNPANKKFYSLTGDSAHSNTTGDIELCYVYEASTTSKHILGSTQSAIVRGAHGINISNQSTVDFYTVNRKSSTAIFDTITDSKSIAKIFATSNVQFAPKDGELGSDGFGWFKDEIFGFRLENGKRGLIKLTADPTAFLEETTLVGGRMVVDIKMEP